MVKYIYYQNISYFTLWVTTVATCVTLRQSGQEQVTNKINLHKLSVLRAVLLKIHIFGCDNVYPGRFLILLRVVVPSCLGSGSPSPVLFLDPLTLKVKAPWPFQMCQTTHTTTQHHISQELNP